MDALEGLGHSGEQHSGAAVVDHRARLCGCRLRIDRHGDVSGAQSSEIGHDEFDAVGSTDRDSMPRYQSVRRQSGSDCIDSSIELSPGHGAAYRPWLNKRHGLGLRLCLTGDKISKVGVDGTRVNRLDRCVEVVHPPESGTRNCRPDIMVMR